MFDLFGGEASTARIVRLEAHAAVRLYEVRDNAYDCFDLPADKPQGAGRKGHSFGKKMKALASFLTIRINPAFQECQVGVVESAQGLAMEVRSVAPAKGQGGISGGENMVFTAPIATLLDVSTDSVIEKENVVFKQLPNTFSPTSTNSSFVRPVATKVPPKKGEIISTLFSAYGDIGLSLTFKAPRESAPSSKQLTKVVLRFVSTTERNEWASFFMEAYVGLLLDSIRSGAEGICPPTVVAQAARDAGAEIASRMRASFDVAGEEVRPPPRGAVEKYIDFFLASSGRAGAAAGAERRRDSAEPDRYWGGAAAADAPLGGVLLVSDGGSQQSCPRRLACERRTTEGGGLTRVMEYLSIRKVKASQRIKKGSLGELLVPLDTFSVYAEDDQAGESFCLELRAPPLSLTASGSIGPEIQLASLQGTGGTSLGRRRSTFAAPEEERSHDPSGARRHGGVCLTIELRADSFSDRRQWLHWFETTLGKQILFLNQARLAAAAERAAAAKNRSRLMDRDVAW